MAAMSGPDRRRPRWRRWGLLAVALLALVAGAATAALRKPGDTFDPSVEFAPTQPQGAAPVPTRGDDEPGRHPADDAFEWPVYGFTKTRTHALAVRGRMRPPFERAWSVNARALLEFTPVLCGRTLFLLNNTGALYAISRTTGQVRWKRNMGYLAAASPTCSHGTVYVVLLSRGRGVEAGRVAAVDAADGRTRWSHGVPSRAESSPLLDDGSLFFGTEDGTVYRLRADDGSTVWRYRASGPVKGALALSDGKLFFGTYGGTLHAITRDRGRRVWSVSPDGAANFYSSAAVAYGRVYIGGTDGAVYSFSARDGKLAWRRRTGDFVYASPAVTTPQGGPPTVYVGSYDGRFYALDARSGSTRWSRVLGDRISGAATVIGDLVFVSELEQKKTWALGVNTGKTVWSTDRGAFNPAISDGRRIYLLGYKRIYAFDPAGTSFTAQTAQRRIDRRAERERADERAQQRRREKYRTAPHGHRHSNNRQGRHCHGHRHTYAVRGDTVTYTHAHCHVHVRRE